MKFTHLTPLYNRDSFWKEKTAFWSGPYDRSHNFLTNIKLFDATTHKESSFTFTKWNRVFK